MESFGAGGKTCILSRVYPSLAIGKNARLYAFNSGKADVKVSRLALLMGWNPHYTQPHPKLTYLDTQPHPTQLVNFSTLTNPPHYKRITHKNPWVLLCRGI